MSAMILNFEEVGCQIGGLANNIKYPISYKCPASLAAERFLQEQPTLPSSSSFPTAAANLAVKEKKQENNRNKQTKAQAQTCSLAKLETGRKSCRAEKLRVQVFRLAGATPALSSSEEKQQL